MNSTLSAHSAIAMDSSPARGSSVAMNPSRPTKPRAAMKYLGTMQMPALPSLALPVSTWVLAQFLALTLVAMRAPLWARAPRASEQLALGVLLVAQLLASSLLFPMLLRDRWAVMAIVLTSWPTLQIAGFLSAASFTQVLRVGAYISLWLTLLGLVARRLRSPRAQLLGVCFASTLVVGGAVWSYLGAEFVGGDEPFNLDAILPIPAVLKLLHAPIVPPWIALALAFAALAMVEVTDRFRAR